eukprot:66874-Chlamydomonas_euryale.AAC.2
MGHCAAPPRAKGIGLCAASLPRRLRGPHRIGRGGCGGRREQRCSAAARRRRRTGVVARGGSVPRDSRASCRPQRPRPSSAAQRQRRSGQRGTTVQRVFACPASVPTAAGGGGRPRRRGVWSWQPAAARHAGPHTPRAADAVAGRDAGVATRLVAIDAAGYAA